MAATGISFLLLIALLVNSIDSEAVGITQPTEWWQTTVIYQVWPNSFQDSDGDGIGDLNGVTNRLDHFVDMGIEVIWLSPIFTSPLIDSGYDVSNYREINSIYGTLEDLDNLINSAHEVGLKIVLDFVPNHTSDEHEWFVKSTAGIEPYKGYYMWDEGKLHSNGTREPPNNWLSVFSTGSAWKWNDERQAYYLHQFYEQQPDLNLTNSLVIEETKDILTFWLDRGIDGFRIDSLPYLVEDSSLADEPLSGIAGTTSTDYLYLNHIYVKDQDENYEIVKAWRDHIDNYTNTKNDGVERVMFTEAYTNVSNTMKYYDYGSHIPFNFYLMYEEEGLFIKNFENASDVVNAINLWMNNMPENSTANWVIGNHDNSRVATRYENFRVDGLNMLLLTLPGVATIYNGDEIGMTDTCLEYDEAENVIECGNGVSSSDIPFRDPFRTPYQWDNTTSAGFSSNETTILPLNSNYLTRNLEAQKSADVSNYKNVRELTKLRNSTVLREGSLDIQVIEDNVIAFARELEDELPIVVLVNWDNSTAVKISLEVFQKVSDSLEVLIADVNSGITVGTVYEKSSVELPGGAAIVLQGISAGDYLKFSPICLLASLYILFRNF